MEELKLKAKAAGLWNLWMSKGETLWQCVPADVPNRGPSENHQQHVTWRVSLRHMQCKQYSTASQLVFAGVLCVRCCS